MINLQKYPYWPAKTVDDLITQLRLICNLRKSDITQIQNINSSFISGRKVGRVPSGSANVVDGDVIGDVNWDTSFLYILVDNGSGGAWRRTALGSW